jgi:putative ABC transport system permease protein
VPRDPKLSQEAETRAITPGYLTTVGSSIVSGRNLDEKEAFESGGVVLISEGMAKRFWPGKDPLGQRLSFGGDTWLRIIAVVADVKQPFDLSGVSDHPVWQVYVSYVENPHSSVSLLLRTQAPPETIGDAMRTAFATVDRDLPLFDVMSLEHMRAQASWIASQWSKTGIIYGVIAMFLSAAGLYGVVAYTVSMRVREIGVRVAMGASRGRVVAFVLHDGLGMMAWGGVTGLAAALLTSRLLSKILYGVAPYDPLTLGAAIALLALTMAVATFIPARRAASVDPSIALRCE